MACSSVELAVHCNCEFVVQVVYTGVIRNGDLPRGDEESAVGDEHADSGERDGAEQEEVQQLPLLHVWDAVSRDAGRGLACDGPQAALPAEAQTLDGLAQRSPGPADLPLYTP